jgi:hypothetical protein
MNLNEVSPFALIYKWTNITSEVRVCVLANMTAHRIGRKAAEFEPDDLSQYKFINVIRLSISFVQRCKQRRLLARTVGRRTISVLRPEA